jgi:hypothetical protein
MEIKRKSIISGIERVMDLPVTQEQLDKYYGPERPSIQNVFPELTAGQREFIKTGITDEEWSSVFGGDEE